MKKRIIAFLLCFALVMPILPANAAETDPAETGTPVTSEPVTPAESSEPAASSEPTEPAPSTEATEPAPSTEATDPADPASSDADKEDEDKTEATDPTDPTEKATDPTDPTVKETDPTDPTEKETEPTEPADTTPSEPTDPSESETEPSTEATEPSEPETEPTEGETVPETTVETIPEETVEETVPEETEPELVATTLESEEVNGLTFKVSGNLPEGTTLSVATVEDETATYTTEELNDYIHYNILGLTDFNEGFTGAAYDITLLDAEKNEYQPIEEVTVTIEGFDTSENFLAEVYHLPNTSGEDIVEAYNTLINTPMVMSLFVDEEAATEAIAGEYIDDVTIGSGSIEFVTSGFSTYYVTSGDASISFGGQQQGRPGQGNNANSHDVYMVPGTTATVTVNGTQQNQSPTVAYSGDTDITYTTSGSTVKITAGASATSGDEGVFTLTVSGGGNNNNGGNNSTTYTVNVHIITADEMTKIQYTANTIEHIQIDIEANAVVLGYENDSSFALDLSFTENTSYTLTTVEDPDSAVGHYYVLRYPYTNADNETVYVNISVRVDELASELPDGITFADVAKMWDISGISIEDGQISFNGTFPVGTMDDYPIVYNITVETEVSITPNDGSADEDVDITVSNTIGYWYPTNECPGVTMNSTNWEAGNVNDGSGIDLGDFSTGAVLGDTTVYVVFSELTKIVEGYTFGATGNLTSRNYVFTLERSKDNGATWTGIDTVTITVDNEGRATASITADAAKYVEGLTSVEDFRSCKFRVRETGYNIAGYNCTVSLKQVAGDNTKTTLTDGVFTWSEKESDDGKSIIFSVEIECTNTYQEKIYGLEINKIVNDTSGNNVSASVADETFSVTIKPTRLDLESEEGVNAWTHFNGGSYLYTVGTGSAQTATVSGGSDSTYGTVTVSIKPGQKITFTNLPAGTYTIQEAAGTNTNYNYDTNAYSVTLTDDTESVTITNILKLVELTIKKVVNSVEDAADAFVFTVTRKGDSTFKKIVVIKGAGEITLTDIPVDTYTVTEDVSGTNWSWRYDCTNATQEKAITTTDNTFTFTNTFDSTSKWLTDTSYAKNVFGDGASTITPIE